MQTTKQGDHAAGARELQRITLVALEPPPGSSPKKDASSTVKIRSGPAFASRWELPDKLGERAPEVFHKVLREWVAACEMVSHACQRVRGIHVAMMNDPWPEADPRYTPTGFKVYGPKFVKNDNGNRCAQVELHVDANVSLSTDWNATMVDPTKVNIQFSATNDGAAAQGQLGAHASLNFDLLRYDATNPHHDGPLQQTKFRQGVWDGLQATGNIAVTRLEEAIKLHDKTSRPVFTLMQDFRGSEEEWDVVCDVRAAFNRANDKLRDELDTTLARCSPWPDVNAVKAERISRGLRV